MTAFTNSYYTVSYCNNFVY